MDLLLEQNSCSLLLQIIKMEKTGATGGIIIIMEITIILMEITIILKTVILMEIRI